MRLWDWIKIQTTIYWLQSLKDANIQGHKVKNKENTSLGTPSDTYLYQSYILTGIR